MRYEDFELKIDPLGDGRYRVSCRSAEGDATIEKPVSPQTDLLSPTSSSTARSVSRGTSSAASPTHPIEGARELDASGAGRQESTIELGQKLFGTFIVDEALDKYHAALAAAKTRGAGLRISVRINPNNALSLDGAVWEALAEGPVPIACNLSTPVVRVPEISVPIDARRNRWRGRLRVLLVLSSPKALPPQLDLSKERANVEHSTRWARWLGAITLRVLENPDIQQLQDVFVKKDWDVLHFAGHGGHDEQGAFLAIACTKDEDCQDGYRKLRSGELALLVRNEPRLALAILNCCHGADIGPSAAPTLAHDMLGAQVLAVVAMQGAIQDASANRFARALYQALLWGRPLEEAMASAREALALSKVAGHEEWWIPALYLRKGIALRVPWGVWLRAAAAALTITVAAVVAGWLLRPPFLSFSVVFVDKNGLQPAKTASVAVTIGKEVQDLKTNEEGIVETGKRARNARMVKVDLKRKFPPYGAVCEGVSAGDQLVICAPCSIDPDREVTMQIEPPSGMWYGTWTTIVATDGRTWTETGASMTKKLELGSRTYLPLQVMIEPRDGTAQETSTYTWRLLQGGKERCSQKVTPAHGTLIDVGSTSACQTARGNGKPRCADSGPGG